MRSQPFLRASGLMAIRDERALFRKLAFELSPGELVRVEGPNGAGKTTLLRILAGLDPDFEGSIERPRARESGCPWRSEILFIGHLPGLKHSLTARENLAWLVSLRGATARCTPAEALVRVGLSGYEDVPVAALSAGQKRRVALARLDLEAAALWILDEPFTAIDRAGVRALEEALAAHAANGGAVLFTTHHEPAMKVRPLMLGGSRRAA